MNVQKNWWELTSCGARFCEDVILALEAGQSVAIVGGAIPWASAFYDKLKGANINAYKAFETICGESVEQPGEYLFNRFCQPEIQSAYWPDKPSYTHAEFLAETDGIMLNQRFIIVRKLTSEKAFFRWCGFVENYLRCVKEAGIDPAERGVFILEYPQCRSLQSRQSMLTVLPFEPREVDVFTYNLVNTSGAYGGYLLNKYAAELVGELCGADIELCGVLSGYEGLVTDPFCTYTAFANGLSAQERKNAEQIDAAVLSAQFKVIFLLIEQKRREIIDRYYAEIARCLPWKNDYLEDKDDPYDMELRDLIFKAGEIGISEYDRRTIRVLRDARNQLAHNHVLSYSEILNCC